MPILTKFCSSVAMTFPWIIKWKWTLLMACALFHKPNSMAFRRWFMQADHQLFTLPKASFSLQSDVKLTTWKCLICHSGLPQKTKPTKVQTVVGCKNRKCCSRKSWFRQVIRVSFRYGQKLIISSFDVRSPLVNHKAETRRDSHAILFLILLTSRHLQFLDITGRKIMYSGFKNL